MTNTKKDKNNHISIDALVGVIILAFLTQGCSYHRARDMNLQISPQCKVMTELPGHYIYRCEYLEEVCFTSRSKWWSQSMDGEISCSDKTKVIINNNG
jgi:hypothetical protein